MPRSIWTGAISFGLVTVPVKLFSAVNRKSVRFNQLNAKTGARVQQKRVDSGTGEEVPYEEIVKGYEVTSDRYVVIEPGELEALEPEKNKTIEITDFVQADQIDPIFYDHPYYLAPGPGGAKPYRLLVEALKDTDRVAIATVVIRQKESLVALRPEGDTLGMSTMLFADEVSDPAAIEELAAVQDVEVKKAELDIAKQLVDSLAGDFDPSKYSDSYRQQVLDLIERKAAGEEIAVQPQAEEEAEPVPDLMAALKASLDAARDSGAAKPKSNSNGGAAKTPSTKSRGARKKPAAKKAAANASSTKSKSTGEKVAAKP